jgi:fermentation-respiration switch protein FrsA (DUF1100 family)
VTSYLYIIIVNMRVKFFLILKKLMLTALTTYILCLLLLFIFQRKLQYIPMGQVKEVGAYGLEGFSEKILTGADGVKILSWYKAPQKNEKIILYFHGNAGNLGDRAHKFLAFSQRGFGVMGVAYRGYSGSEGKPSESGFALDAEAALRFLSEQGYAAKDIILFGESLGSGVVIPLATKFDFAAVILESPFASIVNVAQKQYWFVPVKLLLKDKFESVKIVGKISAPVLIFHGTADSIVPFNEGEKLFAAVKAPKKFVRVEGAGHLNFGALFLVFTSPLTPAFGVLQRDITLRYTTAELTCGQSRCSEAKADGGDKEARTPDPLLAKQVLYQLSYIPENEGAENRNANQFVKINRNVLFVNYF